MRNSSTILPPSLEGDERRTVVVMQRIGRLGNQLSLFANLIAFSLATGAQISHPTLGRYANYFVGTAKDLLCRYPIRDSGHFHWGNSARIAWYYACRLIDKSGILKLIAPGRTLESDYLSLVDMADPSFRAKVLSARYTFLTKGWLFRYPKVEKHQFLQQLRHFFALAEPYKTHVNRITALARENCDVLVGVHIRQTDFKQHAGGRFYFATADYARIMNHCQRLFHPKQVNFLVVSDEAQSASGFSPLKCYFGSGVDVEDMYSLGQCDYIIGSIASSFCLWPAVLFQVPVYQISDASYSPSLQDFKVSLNPWHDD